MNAGQLDTRVTIEQKQTTLDPTYGTELITWIPLVAQAGSPTVGERFAAKFWDVLQAGSESVRQNVALSSGRAVVRIRYRSDVNSSMRVVRHMDSDVVYQIISEPAMIGRKQWLEFTVERYSS